ncbi:MAG: gliding motility-associated C-terminal domain-containing protein [Saprospiraceae bacterium]|nr:gliding motility-associated C-terminal domain-containing protein [Saprospiraceae bacterium]
MKKSILLLALALGFLGEITAQILPPDFSCVRGDTLFWDVPTNACGPFVSYEIWASQNPNGPFVLQATVTNPAQDFYAFVNPSGERWYFYLLSNFNCPGQVAVPSDTLDNRPPEVSPIVAVTVESGQAVVTWEPSPSPEVYAYVIYRQTSIGVVPVDTVFSGFTYTDPDADPTTGTVSYYVNALDPCGNTSIFDVKHTSMFAQAEAVPCRQSIRLTWNPYEGWTNAIVSQEVWVGVNGGALATSGNSIGTSFELGNVMDGATYCFEIRAEEGATGATSTSNQVCIVADIVESARGMYLENVSVNASNETVVTWQWNPLAALVEAQVLRSEQNTDYQPIATVPTTPPLVATNTFNDADGGASAGKVFYTIQTLDGCDTMLTSNYGSTIHLTAVPGNDNQNLLNWTAFDIENATVSAYTVYKVTGLGESLLASLGNSATSTEDNYVPTSIEEAQACYYVVADFELATPNGDIIARESRSNTACVEQAARIFAPNAIVPEGINQEFRPLIVLGDMAEYELRVFDRYGHEVFSTNELSKGWDGRKNGKPLAQGTYAYYIRVKQANGKVTEKKGFVVLIR